MTTATRKSYGWESVKAKVYHGRTCTTVLGDAISKINLYRDGDRDEVSVHKDEATGVFTAVLYAKDGTRAMATGYSEDEACNKVRPPRV